MANSKNRFCVKSYCSEYQLDMTLSRETSKICGMVGLEDQDVFAGRASDKTCSEEPGWFSVVWMIASPLIFMHKLFISGFIQSNITEMFIFRLNYFGGILYQRQQSSQHVMMSCVSICE